MRFVKVFDHNGYFTIAEGEEGNLEADVREFLESGRTRDRVVTYQTPEGGRISMYISSIRAWYLSTPETRRGQTVIEKTLDEERKETMSDLGLNPFED